jgi:hypothetical protein
MPIIAEDGNLYPFARTQAAAMLAAVRRTTSCGRRLRQAHQIYDRMLAQRARPGTAGMLARLSVGSAIAAAVG